ncbi:OsmC family protein [Carnobacterium sp. ISL-102]|uniref:OsmC family protein n=1 Tax=Carnobacterium sp. ISL-102 TaxID=2819142 RepID=UPI001BE89A40|nr:OsmC family protein [Carnobacterium sp. ISL-102]MBT2732397.1 OsmC family protein [Carnobacterium sp. ISL-102]
MANETFLAVAQSMGGLKVSCTSRNFEFILDEPQKLGGSNEGMSPVEALLASLGACKVIVARSFAGMHSIHLNDIRVEVEGILDPDGFMGKNKEAKIGFSTIVSKFYIEADNTDEEISDFIAFINRTCPVADTIENAPTIKSEIHKL